MKRPRILVINSKTLLPNIDGATIRSLQMIRMLAQTCDVDVVYTCSKRTQPKDISPLYAYCKNVVGFTTSAWAMILRGCFGLFSSKPLQCAYFYSPAAQRYIDKHLAEYDFIFCNNIRAAQYVTGRHCRKVIDYVDALSMRYRKEMENVGLVKKLVFGIEYKRLTRYETKVLNEFDGHFIISDIDRQYIIHNAPATDKDIYVINNSTELRPAITQNDKRNLVFVGSMYYDPNIVAVTAFANRVMPEIVKAYPEARFYIVGTRPALSVRKLASDNVIVTGFVDSPQQYLADATLVVVPMISGAGVQNKILEAMSMGCCVVTTQIGAEGLDNIANGHDIVICDDYGKLADEIIALIADRQRRVDIGRNGRLYIKNNLTYEIIAGQFTDKLKQIIAKFSDK